MRYCDIRGKWCQRGECSAGCFLPQRHQEHYRVCPCLGDSSVCCDPTCSCAPDEVNASPYTDDNGDLNAEGEVYLQRAARRIHAASAPDEVNDGETE